MSNENPKHLQTKMMLFFLLLFRFRSQFIAYLQISPEINIPTQNNWNRIDEWMYNNDRKNDTKKNKTIRTTTNRLSNWGETNFDVLTSDGVNVWMWYPVFYFYNVVDSFAYNTADQQVFLLLLCSSTSSNTDCALLTYACVWMRRENLNLQCGSNASLLCCQMSKITHLTRLWHSYILTQCEYPYFQISKNHNDIIGPSLEFNCFQALPLVRELMLMERMRMDRLADQNLVR